MSRLTKLLGNVDVSRSLLLLLFVGGLYSLSIALSNTFVNVFLWKQTGEFIQIAIYNLSIIIAQPLTFIVAGRWIKKIDRVLVLRLGVIFLSAFYLAVLLLGGRASSFIVLLGCLLGIGYGFYWLAFNVLTFEITEPDTRDFFNGFLGLLTSFSGIIGPIFSGYVIHSLEKFTGYTIIFSLSLFLFFVAVILSFFLERRTVKGRYLFSRILQEQKRNSDWKNILGAHFFQGLREGTFVFVIVVWVFIITKSELALGAFGLVQSGVQLIAYYAVTRIVKPKFRTKAILAGGLILYGAVYIILFQLTYVNLLIYAAVIAIAYPLILVPYVSLTYDVIGRAWNAAELRVEYIVVREVYLNLGRVVSILLFITCLKLFQEESIRYLMMVLGTGHLIIYFFVRKISFSSEPSSS